MSPREITKRRTEKRKALPSHFCSFAIGGGTPACRARQRSMYLDPLGHYWCHAHQCRGELLKWARDHGYPHIMCRGELLYAIADPTGTRDDNEALWEVAILLGTDDMIISALRYVKESGIGDSSQ